MGNKSTYIDGVGSSQAIDTAGEVVDIQGLDCSSLPGAPFNWEHKSDLPAQIVGKVLDYKKIFSEDDCETDRQKYYWNKVKMPFLYVMGRLFDDKNDSAREVAGLFLDDAEHPNEPPMVGFSIEGAKISKENMTIVRSIARKVTITNIPANKTCAAEMIPAKKSSKIDSDSLFKGEIELFNPNSKFLQFLEKKEQDMKKDVGSGNGAFIGSQLAMSEESPSIAGWKHTGGASFSHPEHGTLSVIKHPSGEFHVKHNGAIAGVGGKKGVFNTAREAGSHAASYMKGVSSGKISPTHLHNRPSPQMPKSEKINEPLMKPYTSEAQRRWAHTAAGKKALGGSAAVHEWDEATKGKTLPERVSKLNKTLTAGSGLAAPSALVGGAALGKESLERRSKKVNSLGKSQWLTRAEQAYQKWEKREHFEKFMKDKMPHLTKGEIAAIGQTLALQKSVVAEKEMAKYASYYLKNEMQKTTDVMMANEGKAKKA